MSEVKCLCGKRIDLEQIKKRILEIETKNKAETNMKLKILRELERSEEE